MARRTKQEAEATRENILDAALDIIYEKGYARSTFVDIANRIKLTKGAIYWHFKNKPEMFLALAGELEQQIEARMKPVMDNTRTLVDLKRALYEMILLVAREKKFRKYYTTVFYRMEWTDELLSVKHFFEKQDRSMMAWVVDILSHAQSTGAIPKEKDSASLSRALLELVNGLIAYCMIGSPETRSNEASEIVETGLDTFFLGIRAKNTEPNKGDGV